MFFCFFFAVLVSSIWGSEVQYPDYWITLEMHEQNEKFPTNLLQACKARYHKSIEAFSTTGVYLELGYANTPLEEFTRTTYGRELEAAFARVMGIGTTLSMRQNHPEGNCRTRIAEPIGCIRLQL